MKDNNEQKKRIRERYKGMSSEQLEIIPAIPQENIYESTTEKRVAVYVRVSTDDPSQTSSFELQKNYYESVVNSRSGWTLVDIYSDEGISGTSTNHRNAFKKMITDCYDGKIDLIITKTVARFARDLLDGIGYTRALATLRPPVGVLFETENIYSLDSKSEMILAIMATLAQEESRNKSEIMNASIEMRFRRGILLTPPLLGYDQDSEGNLVINKSEAKTVRLIFFMYLYGCTCVEIADTLTKLERPTKKKSKKWSPGSVLNILQNERHCGDVLARKTWTPNYLDHKSQKNKNNRNQYRWTDQHEAIISRDDFIAVQHLINNARYGNKGFLPELHVISEDMLKGFVVINPRWGAFSAEDYRLASLSVYDNSKKPSEPELLFEAYSGSFDLRGFEVARAQFFNTTQKLCITFSMDYILFSSECIKKLDNIKYIEILIHPTKELLIVRSCAKETRNKIRWAKQNENMACPIACTAYINTLYELFNWKTTYKYRIRGIYKQMDKEAILIFNLKETEIFIPQNDIREDKESTNANILSPEIQPFTDRLKKNIMAYPPSWGNSFGMNYYRHAQAMELKFFDNHHKWNVQENGQPFCNSDKLNNTNIEVIDFEIKQMICNMQQEIINNGE